MSKLIVVVGATGKQGGSVIKHLLSNTKSGEWKIRGLSRDTTSSKAKEWAQQGVEMVSCDLSNKNDLVQAFNGAYGVFGVTTPTWGVDNNQEFEHGVNMIEAAVQNKVQHFVFSSLDDVEKATHGKYHVPHFTNKNRVEQEARKSAIPFTTFVYPPFYAENIPFMMFKLNQDKQSAAIYSGVSPTRKLPIFSVDDMGIVVSQVFQHPEQYNKHNIIAAGDFVTFQEMAEICSKVLKVPTQYVALDEEVVRKQMGNEMNDMFHYFSQYGYYQAENEKEEVEKVRKSFPSMLNFEQFVEKNKQFFLRSSP
ncbi:hypothetical protein C9374_005262 [Naegleria lovaniensis]|uniref:NmrA-like domain-containing protein n=1 Tax=Naegleria lovaniensis TaxID=51637 RepID=A0AA88KIX4_NAELO|nr:uncharacterized protein C9374_005262 [Naegleria lovaniensis]KAG2382682.1 hypothetical protein C9374_005262 [Naegleria lovaniensis]